jgi:hypothetical protein
VFAANPVKSKRKAIRTKTAAMNQAELFLMPDFTELPIILPL